jgi:hypothetical protein
MNYRELKAKRDNLSREIDALNRAKEQIKKYDDSIKINVKMDELKKKYAFYNNLLKRY